jgi:CheY-like chemotaxis protein
MFRVFSGPRNCFRARDAFRKIASLRDCICGAVQVVYTTAICYRNLHDSKTRVQVLSVELCGRLDTSVGKLRVFIVEDHPATLRGLKMFLELSGYEVQTAMTMAAAVSLAEKSEFDVLLCDLNLPDGTGWELMQQLCKRRPVAGVAYSAFDEPEHIQRSKAAGFAEHVVKGTTPEALVAAIGRVAKTSQAEPAIAVG